MQSYDKTFPSHVPVFSHMGQITTGLSACPPYTKNENRSGGGLLCVYVGPGGVYTVSLSL